MDLFCKQRSKCKGKWPMSCLGSFVVCRTALVSSKHLINHLQTVSALLLGHVTYH